MDDLAKIPQFRAELAASGAIDVSALLHSGVYLLLMGEEVIYIGKSTCMLSRVYTHISARLKRRTPRSVKLSPVAGIKFDGLWAMPLPWDRLDDVERQMIAKYRPRYNERHLPKMLLPQGLVAAIVARQPLATFERRV